MKTQAEILMILSQVGYKDWDIVMEVRKGDAIYLQVQFDAPCSVTGKMKRQHCRKWHLSPHMGKNEIVRTAYKAVQAAVLHEAAEQFHYRGRTVYSPHFDVEALVTLCDENRMEVREPPSTNEAKVTKEYVDSDACIGGDPIPYTLKVGDHCFIYGEGHGVPHRVVQVIGDRLAVSNVETEDCWWETRDRCYVNQALARDNLRHSKGGDPC